MGISQSPFLTTVVWASHRPLSLNNLEGICHKVFYKILLLPEDMSLEKKAKVDSVRVVLVFRLEA